MTNYLFISNSSNFKIDINIINQINWDEGYYRKDTGWRYIDE